MSSVLNIAAYRFVQLADLPALRARLRADAAALQLHGTILLAPEGINLFLAAPAEPLRAFLAGLRSDARFADLPVKESWSEQVPFRRLRVRLKREIIRMNHPTIRPEVSRAPAIDAVTVKRWLDAGHDDDGRPVVMLDTRNRFEVEAGRFVGALELGLVKFSEFPAAVAAARERLEGRTVVSYCTGGIRCEKASLYMNELGMRHHWQLEVGGAHFEGLCTVFDERSALDPDLRPDQCEETRR
jgi:UPF0176 protein